VKAAVPMIDPRAALSLVEGIPVEGDGDEQADPTNDLGEDEAALLALLEDELSDAEDYIDGEVGDEREKALNYYLRRPMGDEREGRSSTISGEVYKVVEGVATAITNIYAAAKSPVEFAPRKADDVQKAAQRTAAVEYVLNTQNNGFLVMLEAIKDGVLSKAGFLTWRWEKDRRLTRETYRGMTPTQLALITDDNPDASIAEVKPSEREAKNPDGSPMLDESGAPVAMLYDAVVNIVNERGRAVVEAVPPEEILVTTRARSADVQKAPTVFWRSWKTETDLLKCGYGAEQIARLTFTSGRTSDAPMLRRSDEVGSSGDEALIFTAWLEADVDGDGLVELRRVVWAPGIVLDNEVVDEINLAGWTPNIQPHEFVGRCPADDATEGQEVMTAIKRQTLDNLYHANTPMWRVDPEGAGVNVNDFYNPVIGGVVRAGKDEAEPIVMPFMAQHSFPMLEYEQADTENKTGFTRYSQGLDAKSLNQTARGISIVTNMSQQRTMLMARIFGQLCLAPCMRGLAKLLAQHSDRELSFRLNGQFLTVDPREWKEEFDMTCNVGLGVSDPEQQLMHLSAIEAAQMAAVQGGGMGTLISPQNLYNLQAKKAELAGFKDASQFWMNPETAPPQPEQPPPPDPELVKQQAETEREQMKLAAEQQRAELAAQSEQAIAKYRADVDAQVAIERARIDAAAKVEIAAISAQAQPQVNVDNSGGREEFRTGLADQSAAMQAMLEQLQVSAQAMFDDMGRRMTAPRKVLRDPVSGKAIGVQVGDDVMNVDRDDNGRVGGLSMANQ
jgi:hypothetical protein